MAGEEATTPIPPQLRLKLVVNKRKKRLVYAKCDRFMADALLSFLTTPVGALVRRTGKDSGLGCMDSLYQSVEDMGAQRFRTPACRELLLRPRDAWGFSLHRLILRVNDVDNAVYFCEYAPTCPVMGTFPGADCVCGGKMSDKWYIAVTPDCKGDGLAFLRKGVHDFVVTDDLFIAPSSATLKQKLCESAGVEDRHSSLESRIVLVGPQQLVQLMKLALVSNTPLTDAFLPNDFIRDTTFQSMPEEFTTPRTKFCIWFRQVLRGLRRKYNLIANSRQMKIVLLHDKEKTKVFLAKAERDFVDLLFSFLVFPFGSMITALGENTLFGCLDNLHKVMNKFVYDGNTVAEGFGNDLEGNFLNPPIAPHYLPQDMILDMGNGPPVTRYIMCKICRRKGSSVCTHGYTYFKLGCANPKFEEATTKNGGGYVRRSQNFFITNDLVVKPIRDLAVCHFPSNVEETEIVVGQKEALELLRASLDSKDPLTRAFIKLIQFNVKKEKLN